MKDKATPIQCNAQKKSAQILLKECSLHGDILSEKSLSEAFDEDGKELFNTVAQIGPNPTIFHTTCGLGEYAQSKGGTCTRSHMSNVCSMSSWMLPGLLKNSWDFDRHKSLSPLFGSDVKEPWVRGVSYATVSGVLLLTFNSCFQFYFFFLNV